MTGEEFAGLVTKYTDTVFRVALNIVKSPSSAEDVCQEVFLRLWKSRTVFADEEGRRYWLIRVAVNESRRSLRSLRSRNERLEDCENVPCSGPPESSGLLEQVMSLPEKYRIVLYLFYYEGYSTAEIAGLLTRSEAAVRMQLHRGRELLKKRLTEEDDV